MLHLDYFFPYSSDTPLKMLIILQALAHITFHILSLLWPTRISCGHPILTTRKSQGSVIGYFLIAHQ